MRYGCKCVCSQSRVSSSFCGGSTRAAKQSSRHSGVALVQLCSRAGHNSRVRSVCQPGKSDHPTGTHRDFGRRKDAEIEGAVMPASVVHGSALSPLVGVGADASVARTGAVAARASCSGAGVVDAGVRTEQAASPPKIRVTSPLELVEVGSLNGWAHENAPRKLAQEFLMWQSFKNLPPCCWVALSNMAALAARGTETGEVECCGWSWRH